VGKPLTLIRGERYFIARCPKTNEILDAIHDAAGIATALSGEWAVSCSECGYHTFDLSKLKAEVFE
jgi:hypothetical protein